MQDARAYLRRRTHFRSLFPLDGLYNVQRLVKPGLAQGQLNRPGVCSRNAAVAVAVAGVTFAGALLLLLLLVPGERSKHSAPDARTALESARVRTQNIQNIEYRGA